MAADIEFWAKDIPYFRTGGEEERWDDVRAYVVHDNTLVFERENSAGLMFWQAPKDKTVYLIDVGSLTCEKETESYLEKKFRIFRKESWGWYGLYVNGKRIGDASLSLPQNYFELWSKLDFSPLKEVQIVGFGKTKTLKRFVKSYPVIGAVGFPAKPASLPKPSKTDTLALNFTRTLPDDFPRRRWVNGEKNPKAIHIGQRKLLLSEIEFLTLMGCLEKPCLVLYAGAAPGDHLPLLSALFPLCYFILFDPSEIKVTPTNRIIVRQQLFDDDVVQEFSSIPNVLLISDIRSTPDEGLPKAKYDAEFEEHIAFDNSLQRKWIHALKIKGALIKFRTPFVKGKTTFPEGRIYFQAWEPSLSAETRMIVMPSKDGIKDVEYDHVCYEENLFFFNTRYRILPWYQQDLHFGKTFDSTREAEIIRLYLSSKFSLSHSTKKTISPEEVYAFIIFLDDFFGRAFRVSKWLFE